MVDRFTLCRLAEADGGGGRGNVLHHVKGGRIVWEGEMSGGNMSRGEYVQGGCPDPPGALGSSLDK